ncbi:MAG: ATP-binding cassette domain-containing protein [bacterium]|nr:ATP-binding cassette domain-containing protein [bacterium]
MIEVNELTKCFGDFCAVDKVSFSIPPGMVFAFLGPNGAGKSTTIKMLTTILSPTSGRMRVNDFDVRTEKNQVRASIGVIFQDYTLDDDLTAYENMYYHAVLYRVPKQERKSKIEKLLEDVGLSDRKNDLIKNFSGGMKRRVEIVRGLLHSPKVLFLDEPTLGLDVQTRNFLWTCLAKMNKEEGITIFFTTHNLDEAEKIATRIAIIDQGKILISGTAAEIKKTTAADSLEKAFLKLTGYDIREEQADAIGRMRKFRR